jgi:hypothetical protein
VSHCWRSRIGGPDEAFLRRKAPGLRPGPEEQLRRLYARPASEVSAICSAALPVARDAFVRIGSGSAAAALALRAIAIPVQPRLQVGPRDASDGLLIGLSGLHGRFVPLPSRWLPSPVWQDDSRWLPAVDRQHSLALAPPKVAMARPTGVGRALTAYRMPIEGRDEWLASVERLA